MKKFFAILMALAMLLALTACGQKAEQTKPEASQTQEIPVETAPELTEVPELTVPAEGVEGRVPGGEYVLPEEVTSLLEWQREGAVGLLAEVDHVAFYALEGKESTPALLRWGKSQAEFDWQYVTPRAIDPVLWVVDLDDDGEDEVAVNCYGGSGTGVSLEYLHVVEKGDDGILTDYALSWEELAETVNPQLQIICMGGRVYAAFGRELVDITADLGSVDPERVKVCLGQVARYEQKDDGLTCSFGVVLEGEGIPYLSTYVAELEGALRYASDGTFTLTETHLLSI